MAITLEETMEFFGGATWQFFFNSDSNSNHNRFHGFFRPYRSAGDVAARTMSIATGFIPLAVESLTFLVGACGHLLMTMGNTLTLEFGSALDSLKNAGDNTVAFGVLLIAALLSPLANLVGMITAAIFGAPKLEESQTYKVAPSF